MKGKRIINEKTPARGLMICIDDQCIIAGTMKYLYYFREAWSIITIIQFCFV